MLPPVQTHEIKFTGCLGCLFFIVVFGATFGLAAGVAVWVFRWVTG